MPRKPGPVKTTISVAVLPETRKMLVEKSEACGQTVSDLVQVAVVEKYSPRRGLAKRLDKVKDEARLILQQELETKAYEAVEAKMQADARLAKSVKLAEELAEEARLQTDAKLALADKHANERYAVLVARCDKEWEGSLQKLLLDIHLEFADAGFGSNQCSQKLNRVLFDLGIWCVAAHNSAPSSLSGIRFPRFFGSRIWRAYGEVFLSPMFKDINLAADTAAELQTWTVTPEYLHFVLTHYEMSMDRLYLAFTSDFSGELYKQLWFVLEQADKMYGSSLSTVCKGRVHE